MNNFCRNGFLKVGVVLLSLGMFFGPICISPAHADDTSTVGQTRVRIDLEKADMQQAINLLKAQTGADFVILPNDKPYNTVTLSLDDKPLELVLNMICKAAGASLKYENGIYFIGPQSKVDDTVAQPKVTQTAPQPDIPNNSEPAQPPVEHYRIAKIQCYNSRPSELLAQLGIDQGLVNRTATNMIYQPFEQLTGSSYANMMQRPLVDPYVRGINPEILSNAITPIPASAPVSDNANRLGTANRSANSLGQENQYQGGYGGGMGGYGGGMGGYGGGMGGMGGGMGGYGGGMGGYGGGMGGGMGGYGNNRMTNMLPTGITSVLAYDTDNSLIVKADSDDAIRQLKEIVRMLDVAPRQLMIKAELIQVSQTDANSFGINWNLSRGSVQMGNTAGSTPFATGDVFLNYASGNMVAQMLSSLSLSKGKVVSAPMVTTTNNMPVALQIGTEIPIITNQIVPIGLNQTANIPQIQVIGVTSGLFVIPRINGDDSITMNITPQIQDVAQSINNPSGGTIPIITQQTITVTRRIKNGETMVIGGLTRKNDTENVNKVPLLADLPFIGKLFQSTSNSVNDTELLIFVTPTIISDTAGGGSVSTTDTSGGAGGSGAAMQP
jgi:general secretion pathway protein D